MKLNKYKRIQIANRLHPLTTKFYDKIPLQSVADILSDFDLVLMQEDNTEWDGFICGREGHTVFDLGVKSSKDEKGMYTPAENRLYFYWYKFDSTGRYEINMYMI